MVLAAIIADPATDAHSSDAKSEQAADQPELPAPDEQKLVSFALPLPTDGSSLPIPKANPGTWIETDDYPANALSEKRSGRTGFRVDVNKLGRVTKCTIIVSSGHDDLDQAACDYVTDRAIFDAATDKKGRVVVGAYQNSVTWRIPSAIDLPKAGQSTIVFVVEADGTVSDCNFETTVEMPEGFDGCAEPPQFEPRRNEAGEAIRVRVVSSDVTKIFRIKSEPTTSK
jgi:TonB family protein